MEILVADGDRKIRNLIHVTLKAHDYKCVTASSGESAVSLISANNPDIVLLELALPDIDGTEVIQRIRSWSDVPIIVISARKEDADKVMALDAGADDYLTKPFSVAELLARIRVMERRFVRGNREREHGSVFRDGGLIIDFAAGSVRLNGEETALTPIEYKLLCLLAQNEGRVLTHSFLTTEIWGSSWENNVMNLRVFMASLRKKIDRGEVRRIRTHTGVGYRLVRTEEE
ncbi:MAG: response regulator transcription factor [Bacillota bacterium]|jgi:two-component system KDP operon response regulator KdpE